MKNIFSNQSNHKAFTLIEVMVAVMIISVVIASMLQMNGNASHMFSKIKSDSGMGQYASLLINAKNYGFENKNISLDKLLDEFTLDSQLRKRLKAQKAHIFYKELERIDMSEFDSKESSLDDNKTQQEKQVNSALAFEIGRSTLKIGESTTSLLRLRLQ